MWSPCSTVGIWPPTPISSAATISFLLPHKLQTKNNDATLTNAIVSIDQIEALAGIDFLTAIAAQDAGREHVIEGFSATALWER
jgi:hypothetical protein